MLKVDFVLGRECEYVHELNYIRLLLFYLSLNTNLHLYTTIVDIRSSKAQLLRRSAKASLAVECAESVSLGLS